jgi:hypothetical protein
MKNIITWDNGGKTIDRYTVYIQGEWFSMSSNPLSSKGIDMWIDVSAEAVSNGVYGPQVDFKSLPTAVKLAISRRKSDVMAINYK